MGFEGVHAATGPERPFFSRQGASSHETIDPPDQREPDVRRRGVLRAPPGGRTDGEGPRRHGLLPFRQPSSCQVPRPADPDGAGGVPAQGGLRQCVRELRDVIKRRGIGIVHTNTNYDRTAGAIAARLSGARHVASIHSFHSIQHNLTHWLRNRFWTDRFITLGEGAKEILTRGDGIAPERISIVPLGLDPDEMRRSDELRAKVRLNSGSRKTSSSSATWGGSCRSRARNTC